MVAAALGKKLYCYNEITFLCVDVLMRAFSSGLVFVLSYLFIYFVNANLIILITGG